MTRGQAGGDAPPLLTRSAILAADDIPTEDVHVPEWGGTVRVRGMSGGERDAWDAMWVDARTKRTVPKDWRVPFVARCLVDETGKPLFSEKDLQAFAAKSGTVIDRLDDVVRRLSGLGATAEGTSEDEVVADLGKGESDGSGSD